MTNPTLPTHSAVRNLAALSTGQGVAMLAGLVTQVWLARKLGPEGLGVIGFGTAIVAYMSLGAALGTDLWGARLIAKRRTAATLVASRVLGMRFWMLAGIALILAVAMWVLPINPFERDILIIQATAVLAVPVTLDYFFQGLRRQTTSAIRQTLQALAIMALTIGLVQSAVDVKNAAYAQTLGLLAITLGIFIYGWRTYGLGWPDLSLSTFRKTFRGAASFSLSTLINTLFFTMDVVMLGLLAGKAETGLYVAGFRIVVLALIPVGLVFAVGYPNLAGAVPPDRARQLKLYATIVGLLAVLGVPFSISAAPELIHFLYGDAYAAAVPVFMAQILTVAVVHGRAAPDAGLGSWGLQKFHARATPIAAATNLGLNFVLIPAHGAMGAALATLVSQGILVTLLSVLLLRKAGISVVNRQLLLLGCGLVSTGLGFALGLVLSGIAFLAAAVLLNIILTALYVVAFKLITKEDLHVIFRPQASTSN